MVHRYDIPAGVAPDAPGTSFMEVYQGGKLTKGYGLALCTCGLEISKQMEDVPALTVHRATIMRFVLQAAGASGCRCGAIACWFSSQRSSITTVVSCAAPGSAGTQPICIMLSTIARRSVATAAARSCSTTAKWSACMWVARRWRPCPLACVRVLSAALVCVLHAGRGYQPTERACRAQATARGAPDGGGGVHRLCCEKLRARGRGPPSVRHGLVRALATATCHHGASDADAWQDV